MKIKYIILLAFVACAFLACKEKASPTADIPEHEKLYGEYRITRMTSVQAVDLDNDQSSSRNLMKEIKNYFDGSTPDLRIGPSFTGTDPYCFFMIPKTYLPWQYPVYSSDWEFQFSHNGYASAFRLVDEVLELDQKTLYESNTILDEEVKKTIFLESMELLENGLLRLQIRKEFFDCQILDWVYLDIVIEYEKW